MSVVNALWSRPLPATAASRYTVACGAFYMAFGTVTYAWPGIAQTVFMEAPFVGHEEGFTRLVGAMLAIVGWLYVFGGRSGASNFAASTVVDRLLVPAVLAPLIASGLLPHVLATFAVIDPALALGVFVLLRRDAPPT